MRDDERAEMRARGRGHEDSDGKQLVRARVTRRAEEAKKWFLLKWQLIRINAHAART